MTVDAEGGLWIAHWGGGRVSRFAPQGTRDRDVRLPASQITSCTFAGDNLDRMFVTSAAQEREDEPLAGVLFEIEPDARGCLRISSPGNVGARRAGVSRPAWLLFHVPPIIAMRIR